MERADRFVGRARTATSSGSLECQLGYFCQKVRRARSRSDLWLSWKTAGAVVPLLRSQGLTD
eukprot:10448541-Alexandrium_andersonii.AAC.1